MTELNCTHYSYLTSFTLMSFFLFQETILSNAQLFVTLWTVAHQVPLSWNSPGKNTGAGCHALLQGIFPTQGSHPHFLHLLHCRQIVCHCIIRRIFVACAIHRIVLRFRPGNGLYSLHPHLTGYKHISLS